MLTALMTSVSADERPFVFRGVTVIDGTVAGPGRQMDVVSSATALSRLTPRLALRKTRAIDARGKYLLPGLWDMHVHLAFLGHPPWNSGSLGSGCSLRRA